MKIILSRKGFDSSLGKIPSPIFPSGELCSLPIPESMPDNCSIRYEEINDYVLLNSVGRGQEFVLDCQEYPEAVNWLCSILRLQN